MWARTHICGPDPGGWQLKSGPLERFFLRRTAQDTTMRDDSAGLAPDPQIAHNLSFQARPQTVDNLWMNCMLLPCNEGFRGRCSMDAPGFLPTMKLQLSQLP